MLKNLVRGASIALLPIAFSAEVAGQNASVDLIAATGGKCESLVVAGAPLDCSQVKGIIYTHMANGRVLLTLGWSDGGAFSFVGERDSQANPQEYRLYLSRINVASNASSGVDVNPSTISGICTVRMSKDGYVWYRIDCDATGANNSQYRLRFQSNGERIDVKRP